MEPDPAQSRGEHQPTSCQPPPETQGPFRSLRPAAFLALLFAVLFPLWSNAYLSPPDSASYFSYARSLVRDRDMAFANDYQALQFELYFFYVTPASRLSNDWPAGTGVLWTPAFAAAEAAARLAEAAGLPGGQFRPDSPERDLLLPRPNTVGAFEPLLAPTGQSGIYRLFLTLFTAGCCALALWLAMDLAEPFASRRLRLAAAALVLLGTPVGFYTFAFAMMSHVPSMLAAALLIWHWNRTRESRTPRDWAVLGLIAGAMAAIRPQDGVFLCVFLVEAAGAVRRERTPALARFVRGAAIAAPAALAGFAPQMIVWWRLYGNPFQLPKVEEMHWFAPRLFETLFSEYHGMLSWSPLLLLVPVGLVAIGRRDAVLAWALGIALALQAYLNAANEIWWCGGSFGNRRMVCCGLVFVAGIAGLLGATRPGVALPACIACALWNLLLWARERAGLLSLDHFVPWDRAFILDTLAMARPDRFFLAMLGDNAGFGWPTRAAMLAAGIASAVLMQTGRWRLRVWGTRIAVAGAGWWLAAPFAFAIAAARTPAVDPESLNTAIPRRNVSLFNGFYEYGFYNLQKGRLAEAAAAYTRASELRPEGHQPWRYLATIRLQEGDLADALRCSGRALDLVPNYEAALQIEYEAISQLLQEADRTNDTRLRDELVARWKGRVERAGMAK